jgi:hypothetical protein
VSVGESAVQLRVTALGQAAQRDDGLGGRWPSRCARLQRYQHGRLRAGRTARWAGTGKRRHTVSERLVCPGRRAPPSSSPLKAPGITVCVSVFPRSRRRITTRCTCDKHSAYLPYITARHVDNSGFLRMHRHGWRFPQVKGPPWVRPGTGIPSISTAHAQAKCCCPQVIHIFVHSQQVSSPSCRANRYSRSAHYCSR